MKPFTYNSGSYGVVETEKEAEDFTMRQNDKGYYLHYMGKWSTYNFVGTEPFEILGEITRYEGREKTR